MPEKRILDSSFPVVINVYQIGQLGASVLATLYALAQICG